MAASIHYVDICIIVMCLLAVAAVGINATIKRQGASSQEYFLSGSSLSWWAVGASLFASNIGTEHFVGLSGIASMYGVVPAFFELTSVLMLLILGHFVAPVYIRCRLSTGVTFFVPFVFVIHCFQCQNGSSSGLIELAG